MIAFLSMIDPIFDLAIPINMKSVNHPSESKSQKLIILLPRAIEDDFAT